MFQDKTQTAENGVSFSRAAPRVGALRRRSTEASGNLPAGELGSGRPWRRLKAPTLGAPLGKDQAITCKTCLTVNHFPTR